MSKSISLQQSDANARAVVFWTPARFLLVGGSALIVLGFSGVLGISQSLSAADLFNPPRWINWLHLSVGTAAMLVAFRGQASVQCVIAFVPAVLGSTLGIAGLALSLYAGPGKASDLSDHLAHLFVGAMASWATWNAKSRVV